VEVWVEVAVVVHVEAGVLAPVVAAEEVDLAREVLPASLQPWKHQTLTMKQIFQVSLEKYERSLSAARRCVVSVERVDCMSIAICQVHYTKHRESLLIQIMFEVFKERAREREIVRKRECTG